MVYMFRFAGHGRPWVTVVVVLVVLWLIGVAVVLIFIFLIWRLAKKENKAGGLGATFYCSSAQVAVKVLFNWTHVHLTSHKVHCISHSLWVCVFMIQTL